MLPSSSKGLSNPARSLPRQPGLAYPESRQKRSGHQAGVLPPGSPGTRWRYGFEGYRVPRMRGGDRKQSLDFQALMSSSTVNGIGFKVVAHDLEKFDDNPDPFGDGDGGTPTEE